MTLNAVTFDKHPCLLVTEDETCVDYVTFCHKGGWSRLLLLFGIGMPYITSLGIVLSGYLRKRDLATLLYGFAVFIQALINAGLRSLIRDPRPLQGICGYRFGMPADGPQYLAFSYTLIAAAAYCTRRRVGTWTIVAMIIFMGVTLFTYPFLEYNTVAQSLIGALLGILLALLFVALIHGLSVYFDRWVEWYNGMIVNVPWLCQYPYQNLLYARTARPHPRTIGGMALPEPHEYIELGQDLWLSLLSLVALTVLWWG